MLRLLRLRNFALIEVLELEFGEGFCLLTGETGAGKSLLVEAVGLLAGDRADTEMVRTGADEALVEGVFEPAGQRSAVEGLLRSWELDAGDGQVVIRRRIQRGGRGGISVNGGTLTLAQLKELGSRLVRIHGQHQSQSLLDEDSHRQLLDASPKVRPAAERTALAHADLARALGIQRTLQRTQAERAQRLDMIRFQMEEIDRISPRAGEEEDLTASRGRLQNVERIVEAANAVAFHLRDGEGAASAQLAEASRNLQHLAEMDPSWDAYLRDLKGAAGVVASIASEAEKTSSTTVFDPDALERVLQRLSDLDRLKRKYGPSLDDVLAHRDELQREHGLLTGGPQDTAEAQRRSALAFEAYMAAAGELSTARKAEAGKLASAVVAELRPLAMEKARFAVELVERAVREPQQAEPDGLESVRFLFSANPGEPPKPLAKIASGGELSRTLLAILTAAHGAGGPHSLIFDEVDAGIGGRPAERVGRRLRDLAARHQVLCITHLPQIAAFAHHHVLLTKEPSGSRTVIAAKPLKPEERRSELARMLAGERVTETALQHAAELLRSAADGG